MSLFYLIAICKLDWMFYKMARSTHKLRFCFWRKIVRSIRIYIELHFMSLCRTNWTLILYFLDFQVESYLRIIGEPKLPSTFLQVSFLCYQSVILEGSICFMLFYRKVKTALAKKYRRSKLLWTYFPLLDVPSIHSLFRLSLSTFF